MSVSEWSLIARVRRNSGSSTRLRMVAGADLQPVVLVRLVKKRLHRTRAT